MLADLGLSVGDIDLEAIVHFDEQNGILRSAGCVAYNEHQSVVLEENWTELITPLESLVLDSTEEYSSSANHPELDLSLTAVGLKRAENRHLGLNDIKADDVNKDNKINA